MSLGIPEAFIFCFYENELLPFHLNYFAYYDEGTVFNNVILP